MYIFIPTLGEQVSFHCEGTLKKILDWNERPLNPPHGLEGGVGFASTRLRRLVLGRKKRRKQRPVSFESVYVDRAWGYATLTMKELINTLQTTLGKSEE